MTVQLRTLPTRFLILRSVRYLLVLHGLQAMEMPSLTGHNPHLCTIKGLAPPSNIHCMASRLLLPASQYRELVNNSCEQEVNHERKTTYYADLRIVLAALLLFSVAIMSSTAVRRKDGATVGGSRWGFHGGGFHDRGFHGGGFRTHIFIGQGSVRTSLWLLRISLWVPLR